MTSAPRQCRSNHLAGRRYAADCGARLQLLLDGALGAIARILATVVAVVDVVVAAVITREAHLVGCCWLISVSSGRR